MSADDALALIARSTGALAERELGALLARPLELRAAGAVPAGANPFADLPYPLAACALAFAGVGAGGLVLALPCAALARLAAEAPPAPQTAEGVGDADGALAPAERSLLAGAAERVALALAGSFAQALGVSLQPAPAQTRSLASAEEAAGLGPGTGHAVSVSFALGGEPCLLVQHVSEAVIAAVEVRLEARRAADAAGGAPAAPPLASSQLPLHDIRVRVGAELGRATLPLARAVALGGGAVIELDRGTDDPIDLYVNGRRFAVGRLLQLEQGEWAIRIEEVLPVQAEELARDGLAA